MDKRIEAARKALQMRIDSETMVADEYEQKYYPFAGPMNILDAERESLALLTAEPEPCEDALDVARRIDERMHCIEGTPGFERLVQVRSILDVEGVAKEIDSYASHVADRRANELRVQVDTLREALKMYADESFYFPRGIVLECQKKGIRLAQCYSEFGVRAKEALAATEPKP